jgi:ribosomal protein L13
MFYTYLWLREDGTPYYVGKGKGKRAFKNDGERTVKHPECDFRIIVQHWTSEQEAFAMEKFWIALYGRKDLGTGILRNRTDGGDGPSGAKRSASTIANMAKRMRGKKMHTTPHSEETKAVLVAKTKALWETPEFRARQTAAHKGQGKGRKMSEETKALLKKNHNPVSNKNLCPRPITTHCKRGHERTGECKICKSITAKLRKEK